MVVRLELSGQAEEETASMANEVQTQAGRCSTHGTVEATREVPRPQFPFVIYVVRRFLAARRPFRCPTCGTPVTTA
jgi:hypothetical protein